LLPKGQLAASGRRSAGNGPGCHWLTGVAETSTVLVGSLAVFLLTKEGSMRRLVMLLIVVWSLGLSGCAMGDLMYSLFGGADSNQADMNRTNSRNSVN
jgi:hypothetical protein